MVVDLGKICNVCWDKYFVVYKTKWWLPDICHHFGLMAVANETLSLIMLNLVWNELGLPFGFNKSTGHSWQKFVDQRKCMGSLFATIYITSHFTWYCVAFISFLFFKNPYIGSKIKGMFIKKQISLLTDLALSLLRSSLHGLPMTLKILFTTTFYTWNEKEYWTTFNKSGLAGSLLKKIFVLIKRCSL